MAEGTQKRALERVTPVTQRELLELFFEAGDLSSHMLQLGLLHALSQSLELLLQTGASSAGRLFP